MSSTERVTAGSEIAAGGIGGDSAPRDSDPTRGERERTGTGGGTAGGKKKFDIKKMVWVALALILGVGAPVIFLAFFGGAKSMAVAGVVVAVVGKLAEQISKTREVESDATAKDGFLLFGEGVTTFGALMAVLAVVYNFDF